MHNINEIYKMLLWHSSFENQRKGIELARELDDLSLIILPGMGRDSKLI